MVADVTAPETKISGAIAFRENGGKIYTAFPYVMILEAKDNLVGVQEIQYSFNGGSFETYEGPVAMPRLPINKITYRAKDWLGNEEVPKTITVNLVEAGTGLRLSTQNNEPKK